MPSRARKYSMQEYCRRCPPFKPTGSTSFFTSAESELCVDKARVGKNLGSDSGQQKLLYENSFITSVTLWQICTFPLVLSHTLTQFFSNRVPHNTAWGSERNSAISTRVF